ncbi:MAG TPA: hypothetical protein K8V08_02870 [Brevibacterium senegalense]|uniref:Uncharacterized protein n=1 Tax=Brevibacterium senegalense TaxID=1033736 RepID=A0A921MCR0_9MICO|nr:hypothetical protein [Brevibacterium senegalense]
MLALRLLAAIACTLGLLVPGAAARATPLTATAGQTAQQASQQAEQRQAAQAVDPRDSPADGVVVIGAAGLTLSDLSPDRTPHLWNAFTRGAAANMSVRTLTPATCAAAGWLSLGAGARMHSVDLTPDWFSPLLADTSCPRMVDPVPAAAVDDADDAEAVVGSADAPGTAGTPLESGPAVLPDFERVGLVNEGAGYSAVPGAFTRPAPSGETGEDTESNEAEKGQDSAADAGTGGEWCTAAYGRGAAYAAADAEGRIANWAPATALTDAGDDAHSATIGTCDLTLIDAGTAADQTWEPNAWHAWNDEALGRTRTGQIAALDDRVGRILEQVPQSSDVIIAGVGDADYPSRLRALIAVGPSYEPGDLRGSSTRQPGLVQLTDVLPAALGAVGLQTEGTSPAAFEVDPADPEDAADAEEAAQERMDRLVADSRKAGTVHTHAQTFSVFLDVVHYVLTIVLAIILLVPVVRTLRSRSPRAATRLRRVGAWVAFTIGLIPMGGFLAGLLPWGRMPNPEWGLLGAVIAGTAMLLGISLVGPWRRTWPGRVAAVSLVTAIVLVVDVAIGSRLQFNALMGYNPIVAGRFYGLGNQGAALFLVAALLGLGIVAARLQDAGRAVSARVLVGLFGLGSVFVLGNPAWGAKFGGTVAALVGFTVLLLALFRIRVSLVRLVLIGGCALAVIVGVSGLDYLRPPAQRSHFGNFFAQALDGQLIDVIARKLEANLRIMVINPALAIVVPLSAFTILFSLAYLRRYAATARLVRPWAGTLPQALAHPTVHAGFLSAVIALGVGLVITDSGIAVPASGAMMLVPMLLALCADVPPDDREATPESDEVARS